MVKLLLYGCKDVQLFTTPQSHFLMYTLLTNKVTSEHCTVYNPNMENDLPQQASLCFFAQSQARRLINTAFCICAFSNIEASQLFVLPARKKNTAILMVTRFVNRFVCTMVSASCVILSFFIEIKFK